MNWGDTLCGVEVTPESWNAGGVFEGMDGWYIGIPQFINTSHAPIFPPRGWAGKSDAELYNEIFHPYNDLRIGEYVNVMRNGRVYLKALTIEGEIYPADEALVRDINNALVLQARLKEQE